MTKKYTVLLLFILAFSGMAKAQYPGYKNVNAEEFKKLIEKNNGVLIDLRTPDEIKKGKIKGAQEMDFLATDFEAKLDKLDKKKTYYIYCAGGGRSADCAELMVSKGFVSVYNLQKGFAEWTKMKYQTEQK